MVLNVSAKVFNENGRIKNESLNVNETPLSLVITIDIAPPSLNIGFTLYPSNIHNLAKYLNINIKSNLLKL